MSWVIVNRRALLAACIVFLAGGLNAQAQGRLSAQYAISMTGVTIGHMAWTVDIGNAQYMTAASGKASGVASVLIHGEGEVATVGMVENWHLKPAQFHSHITDDDGLTDLTISFAGDMASVSATPPLKSTPERAPVTDADLRGVADPLSAVLITARPGESFFSPGNCDHVLAIFDGRRRYDLALSFKRIDKFALKQSYAGPVLVCNVVLKPIAGYKPDSLLVKYVAGRKDMELWFAPIPGTAVMAPIRVAMPTLIGTLKIEADRFDAMETLPPPPPNPPPPTSEPPPIGTPPPAH
jgi:hypothetical protein